MPGGNLTRDHDIIVFDHAFGCHPAVFIMNEAVRNDGTRNLVTDLIRMTAGNLLTCKYFTGNNHTVYSPFLCTGARKDESAPGQKKRAQAEARTLLPFGDYNLNTKLLPSQYRNSFISVPIVLPYIFLYFHDEI